MRSKYFKLVFVSISAFIFACLIHVSNTHVNFTPDSVSANSTLDQKLESSNKITLLQNFFSYSTSYDIKIKDKTVGHITGDFYHPFGDTLRITDMHNKTIYSEEQQSRWLNMSFNRGGVFKTKSGNSDGAIEENFTFMNHEFQIYNKKGKSVGLSTKDPWHLMSNVYNLTDNNDTNIISGEAEQYHINKQIVIHRKAKSKDISMKKAILIMTIEEAIEEKDND